MHKSDISSECQTVVSPNPTTFLPTSLVSGRRSVEKTPRVVIVAFHFGCSRDNCRSKLMPIRETAYAAAQSLRDDEWRCFFVGVISCVSPEGLKLARTPRSAPVIHPHNSFRFCPGIIILRFVLFTFVSGSWSLSVLGQRWKFYCISNAM